MTLKTRILALVCLSVFVTALLLVSLGASLSSGFSARATQNVMASRNLTLRASAHELQQSIALQAEMLTSTISKNLDTLLEVGRLEGGLARSSDVRPFDVYDQQGNRTSTITAHPLTLAGKPIKFVRDPAEHVPIVDTVQRLSFADGLSLFVRINEAGDMYRQAAIRKDASGQRAAGTVMAAVGPDGAPSKVIETVLRGEKFLGVAYPYGKPQVLGYAPIFDSAGKVVGMVGLGAIMSDFSALRSAITQFEVGETGNALVVAASGPLKGQFLVAPQGAEDFAPVAESKVGIGATALSQIIAKSTDLKWDGELKDSTGLIESTGPDGKPWVAAYSYYKPWDWGIILEAPASDFAKPVVALADGRASMIRAFVWAGLLALVFAGVVSVYLVSRTMVPLNRVVSAMNEISEG